MAKKPTEQSVVDIKLVQKDTLQLCLVGTTPLMPHAVSAKSAAMLLFPPLKLTAAEKVVNLKHEPWEEFRASSYQFLDTDEEAKKPTKLYMPAGSFHRAMADVAIDLAGAKKAQIGRLTSIPGGKIPVWGTPTIKTMIVRSSDMARTPDVRTLPFLEHWCAIVTVQFVATLIKHESIINLMANAGSIIGVGDGRPQKGYFDYGCWRVANPDDKEFAAIQKEGARKAQVAALANPIMADLETERLLAWYQTELETRRAAPVKAPGKKKSEASIAPAVAATTQAKRNGRSRLPA